MNFQKHVKGVLDMMKDSCEAKRCEHLLTYKSVYEMPNDYYIKSKLRSQDKTRVLNLIENRFN